MMLRGGLSIGRPGVLPGSRVRFLRLPLIELYGWWTRDTRSGGRDWGLSLAVTIGPLWGRTMLAYGPPPGSRIGFWRTRGGLTGTLQGVNARVGRRYVGPCVTWLAHGRVKGAWQ